MLLVMVHLLASTLRTDPARPFQSTAFLLRQSLHYQMAHPSHDHMRLLFVLVPAMRTNQRRQLAAQDVGDRWQHLDDQLFNIHGGILDGFFLNIRMHTFFALLLYSLPAFDSHPWPVSAITWRRTISPAA